MTVIATLIGKGCCAFATDSLITEKFIEKKVEKYRKIECKETKIIRVDKFSGAMAYWGLARKDDLHWRMLDFLRKKASSAGDYKTPESFAENIRAELNYFISHNTFLNEKEKGLGIHFTAYENIDGINIPEQFTIRNFDGVNYDKFYPDGVRKFRETFSSLPVETQQRYPNNCDHSNPDCRKEVYDYLLRGGLFIYNNGFPELFMSSASSLFESMRTANKRNILASPENASDYRNLISWPVREVIDFEKMFIKKDFQTVGGILHTLSVTSNKVYVEEEK